MNSAKPSIVLIGTLDTKGEELACLAGLIESQGATAVLLDSSTGPEGTYSAGAAAAGYELITREQVAQAAGTTVQELTSMERGEAISIMRIGVAEVTRGLADRGEIAGAICVGGAGAHLAGPAFQALAIGFPKLIVSPLASGIRTFEAYVGLRDVAVLHSVADVAGVNSITFPVYVQAAGYIVGAARAFTTVPTADGTANAIAVSMNGNTTPALTRARLALESAGYSCVSFHANGAGGRALEDFVASGKAVAALDYTTTELSAHLVGGLMDPGPDRMRAAGRAGIPQVLVPGCVDFITCGRWDDAERQFPGRLLFAHNPELTLVRLTAEEMAEVGRIFASKASAATGPTTICVPTQGYSVPDIRGGDFWDPDADAAFVGAVQAGLRDDVRLQLIDAHINDDAFIDTVLDELTALIDLPRKLAERADTHPRVSSINP
jgi:uncharacterized protein (UPF0261 family)